MTQAILVLNAGSSSLKFALYGAAPETEPRPWCRGLVDGIGAHARLVVHPGTMQGLAACQTSLSATDHLAALGQVLDWLAQALPGLELAAAGHRVVHGGATHAAPVRVDAGILAELESLVPLSPLHQPHCLAGIRALASLRPGLVQVACFDTAFHRSLPEVAQRFALPGDLVARGIRRYGFHGLSYEHIAQVLPGFLGEVADGRVVVAHLGNGASLCALRQRRSVETSMGFTPLDGIPMGTRCGALDPGVLLYLMREEGLDEPALSRLLHHRCGLLGLSGISADVRDLLASDRPEAALALEVYAYRIAQAVGGLASVLGGLDALVFTAGVGEHAARVRADICQRLGWLGLELDPERNQAHGPRISQSGCRVSAWVIPTDEEAIILRHTRALTWVGMNGEL